jgi:hypothetical protein
MVFAPFGIFLFGPGTGRSCSVGVGEETGAGETTGVDAWAAEVGRVPSPSDAHAASKTKAAMTRAWGVRFTVRA